MAEIRKIRYDVLLTARPETYCLTTISRPLCSSTTARGARLECY